MVFPACLIDLTTVTKIRDEPLKPDTSNKVSGFNGSSGHGQQCQIRFLSQEY